MRIQRLIWLFVLAVVVVPGGARGQLLQPAPEPTKGPRLGSESVHLYKVGLIIEAVGGPCRGLYGTFAIPTDWPEQDVVVAHEDISSSVTVVKERSLDLGLKQKLISVPSLPAGETATAVITYEITRRPILPPDDPSLLVVPRRVPATVRPYLGTSVYIDPRHRRIRDLAREITADHETAWEQVEAIWNDVRKRIEHRTTNDRKAVPLVLAEGFGGSADLTALFVALCRAHKVPARMVWTAGYCYAEFYLEDDDGAGHWIPCQLTGTPQFGENTDLRTIMQKGENFKVPEKTERLPYVREFIKGQKSRSSGRPRVTFVREAVAG